MNTEISLSETIRKMITPYLRTLEAGNKLMMDAGVLGETLSRIAEQAIKQNTCNGQINTGRQPSGIREIEL